MLSRIVISSFCRNYRLASTSLKNVNLFTVAGKNDCLQIEITNDSTSRQLTVPLVWLRDHCTSEKCFNVTTNQRNSNVISLIEESEIQSNKDVSIKNGNTLRIKWKDGHVSNFESDVLWNNILDSSSVKNESNVSLWSRDTLSAVPRHELSSFSFPKFAKDFLRYGFAIVDGIEVNASATEQFCKEIAPIHDTFFGTFWVFSNDSNTKEGEEYHEDTAYGNEAIGPHTDGTYFNQTPGIQVFHCLHPAKKGGDTVLVDGWNCADILRVKHPDAFRILASTPIDHHYLEGEHGEKLTSISRQKPIIKLRDDGEIQQIRFNPYDRAPFQFASHDDNSVKSAQEAINFYKAYSLFSRICHEETNSIRNSLQPGSVIFIDNFRVFHSRTMFQGWRQMCGCYLSRDNFMAKVRPLFPNSERRSI